MDVALNVQLIKYLTKLVRLVKTSHAKNLRGNRMMDNVDQMIALLYTNLSRMELVKDAQNMRESKETERNVALMSVRTKKLKLTILMVCARNVMTTTVLMAIEESAFKIHALEIGKN